MRAGMASHCHPEDRSVIHAAVSACVSFLAVLTRSMETRMCLLSRIVKDLQGTCSLPNKRCLRVHKSQVFNAGRFKRESALYRKHNKKRGTEFEGTWDSRIKLCPGFAMQIWPMTTLQPLRVCRITACVFFWCVDLLALSWPFISQPFGIRNCGRQKRVSSTCACRCHDRVCCCLMTEFSVRRLGLSTPMYCKQRITRGLRLHQCRTSTD